MTGVFFVVAEEQGDQEGDRVGRGDNVAPTAGKKAPTITPQSAGPTPVPSRGAVRLRVRESRVAAPAVEPAGGKS